MSSCLQRRHRVTGATGLYHDRCHRVFCVCMPAAGSLSSLLGPGIDSYVNRESQLINSKACSVLPQCGLRHRMSASAHALGACRTLVSDHCNLVGWKCIGVSRAVYRVCVLLSISFLNEYCSRLGLCYTARKQYAEFRCHVPDSYAQALSVSR